MKDKTGSSNETQPFSSSFYMILSSSPEQNSSRVSRVIKKERLSSSLEKRNSNPFSSAYFSREVQQSSHNKTKSMEKLKLSIQQKITNIPTESFFSIYREDAIKFLKKVLLSIRNEKIKIVNLCGMVGLGKKQLAIEYARDLLKSQQDTKIFIFMLNANNKESLNMNCKEILRQYLEIPYLNLIDNGLEMLFDEIKIFSNWTLIFTNADDQEIVESILFQIEKIQKEKSVGTILITSQLRIARMSNLSLKTIPMESLSWTEIEKKLAVKVLNRFTGLKDGEGARELAEHLGYAHQSLYVAAIYIKTFNETNDKKITYQNYFNLIKKNPLSKKITYWQVNYLRQNTQAEIKELHTDSIKKSIFKLDEKVKDFIFCFSLLGDNPISYFLVKKLHRELQVKTFEAARSTDFKLEIEDILKKSYSLILKEEKGDYSKFNLRLLNVTKMTALRIIIDSLKKRDNISYYKKFIQTVGKALQTEFNSYKPYDLSYNKLLIFIPYLNAFMEHLYIEKNYFINFLGKEKFFVLQNSLAKAYMFTHNLERLEIFIKKIEEKIKEQTFEVTKALKIEIQMMKCYLATYCSHDIPELEELEKLTSSSGQLGEEEKLDIIDVISVLRLRKYGDAKYAKNLLIDAKKIKKKNSSISTNYSLDHTTIYLSASYFYLGELSKAYKKLAKYLKTKLDSPYEAIANIYLAFIQIARIKPQSALILLEIISNNKIINKLNANDIVNFYIAYEKALTLTSNLDLAYEKCEIGSTFLLKSKYVSPRVKLELETEKANLLILQMNFNEALNFYNKILSDGKIISYYLNLIKNKKDREKEELFMHNYKNFFGSSTKIGDKIEKLLALNYAFRQDIFGKVHPFTFFLEKLTEVVHNFFRTPFNHDAAELQKIFLNALAAKERCDSFEKKEPSNELESLVLQGCPSHFLKAPAIHSSSSPQPQFLRDPRQDPFEHLTPESLQELFTWFHPKTLAQNRLVSRRWNQEIANYEATLLEFLPAITTMHLVKLSQRVNLAPEEFGLHKKKEKIEVLSCQLTHDNRRYVCRYKQQTKAKLVCLPITQIARLLSDSDPLSSRSFKG